MLSKNENKELTAALKALEDDERDRAEKTIACNLIKDFCNILSARDCLPIIPILLSAYRKYGFLHIKIAKTLRLFLQKELIPDIRRLIINNLELPILE